MRIKILPNKTYLPFEDCNIEYSAISLHLLIVAKTLVDRSKVVDSLNVVIHDESIVSKKY
jgi:hypothetical protein